MRKFQDRKSDTGFINSQNKFLVHNQRTSVFEFCTSARKELEFMGRVINLEGFQ